MDLRNLVTGGQFSCGEEQATRLLAEGGYEKVGAEPAAPQKAPAKKAAPRRTHKAETE